MRIKGKRNSQHGRRQQGDKSPTRPTRRGQDTENHCGKPFLEASENRPVRHTLPLRAAVSLRIEADT
jgi:hypothetical protein